MTGRQSNSSGKGISELPSCLIQVILVKLPVKIVVICKCVCKSWNQLILDPYFTSLYSKNSPFTAMLLLQFPQANRIPFPIDRDFRVIEIGSNDDDVVHTPFNLDTLISSTSIPEIAQGEYRIKHLVGSVNGLVCVVLIPYILKDGRRRRDKVFRYNSELFFIINPLTGESVKLPQVKGGENKCRGRHGFCSTVDGDYYKILRLIETCDENDEIQWDLKILTVGVDDEWRDIDVPAFLHDNFFISGGVALNGALHWVVIDLESRIKSVYAFDVGKEVGCLIPFPSNSPKVIGVWDGHICVVQEKENGFDVWTMKQYGVAGSWTKDIILGNSTLSRNICSFAIPKTTRRNGDLLLSIVFRESRKSLISFDPKTKNCVKLDEAYDDEDTTSDLFEYAPCFSSLSRQITIRDP